MSRSVQNNIYYANTLKAQLQAQIDKLSKQLDTKFEIPKKMPALKVEPKVPMPRRLSFNTGATEPFRSHATHFELIQEPKSIAVK